MQQPNKIHRQQLDGGCLLECFMKCNLYATKFVEYKCAGKGTCLRDHESSFNLARPVWCSTGMRAVTTAEVWDCFKLTNGLSLWCIHNMHSSIWIVN